MLTKIKLEESWKSVGLRYILFYVCSWLGRKRRTRGL